MKKTMIDKQYGSYTTNDGYIISEWFCNPIKIKRDINSL